MKWLFSSRKPQARGDSLVRAGRNEVLTSLEELQIQLGNRQRWPRDKTMLEKQDEIQPSEHGGFTTSWLDVQYIIRIAKEIFSSLRCFTASGSNTDQSSIYLHPHFLVKFIGHFLTTTASRSFFLVYPYFLKTYPSSSYLRTNLARASGFAVRQQQAQT